MQRLPIKYDELMALKNLGQKYAYTDREVMLYAYGIGMGAAPDGRNELAFVNEAAATPRPLKSGADFCVGRGMGCGARRDESQPRDWWVDGERDITSTSRWRRRPTSPPIPAWLDVLRQGQGQGRGDPAPDGAQRREGREVSPHCSISLRAWRRWFWAGRPRASPNPHEVPMRARRQTIDIATRPDQALVLSALRRPQSAATRSGICETRRLSETDPARHVHLRHHLSRYLAEPMRLRSERFQAARCAGFPAVYPGETVTMELWKDGNVHFIRSQGKGARPSP